MRLLNTETVNLHDFFGKELPPYAILSHRWEEDEVSYKDVMKGRNLEAAGWTKVRQCCSFVRRVGFQWVWIDTCCIDKRSSSELAESINSMYKWYQGAEMCFVYLADVQCRPWNVHSYEHLARLPVGKSFSVREVETPHERQPEPIEGLTLELFQASKWFTRGWTLQELLAPRELIFLDSGWNMFGSKRSLNEVVSAITGIADAAFRSARDASVATKMSWAAWRSCTRPEDLAYSLLGMFDVNMPLLYGEGARQAFERLQLEIIKRSGDESIFTFYNPAKWARVLANSPEDFAYGAGIRLFEPRIPRAPYTCTHKGLEISTVLLPSRMSTSFGKHKIYFMPLNCAREGALKPMAIRLGRINDDEYFRIGIYGHKHYHDDRYKGLKWPEEADLDLPADIKTVKIHIINYDFGFSRRHPRFSIDNEDVVESLRVAVDKYMPAHCAVGKMKDEKKAITDSI